MKRNLEQYLQALSAHVDSGHQKTDAAFLRQVREACRRPDGKPSWSSTMAGYRFARNERLDVSALRDARRNFTLEQAEPQEPLLAISDVSILSFFHHESKADRRAVGDGKGKGYEYVCALAVGLHSGRVYGVLHDSLVTQSGPDDAEAVDYRADPWMGKSSRVRARRLACNHKHQLLCHARYLRARAPGRRFVHVADREFDDHLFFEDCLGAGDDCVIRSNAVRNVLIRPAPWVPVSALTPKYPGLPQPDGWVCADMRELIGHEPVLTSKEIALDAEGRLCDPRLAHERITLSVGAFTVKLYRDGKRNRRYLRPRNYVTLNVVVAREPHPPAGRPPICWVLFTSLPIDTPAQVLEVVRIYELRWRIECFFKYLKSGFKIEDLRYDDGNKIAKLLVPITLAAVFVLNLKQQLGLPAGSFLDTENYLKIKHASKNLHDPSIDLDTRLFAFIANCGGWLGRRNDPISPLALMRGMARAMQIIDCYGAAPAFLQEILESGFFRRRE